MRALLSGAGLTISTGKMSQLWSGEPITIRLTDLEVICRVLDCKPSDLLVLDSASLPAPVLRVVPAPPARPAPGARAGVAGRTAPPL